MKTTPLCLFAVLMGAAGAILLATGCQQAEVNFSINGREDTLPITEMPTDPNDTKQVISVMVNEPVVFQDLSQPAGKVKSRQWDFNGDGVPDSEDQSVTYPPNALPPGFYKVVLCINGTSRCMARCLYVAPLPAPDTLLAEAPNPDTLPAPEPEPVPEKPRKETQRPKITQQPSPKPAAPKPAITEKPAAAKPAITEKPAAPKPTITEKPAAPKPTITEKPAAPKPAITEKPQPAPIKPTVPADKPATTTKQATKPPVKDQPPRNPGAAGLPLASHPADNDCFDYKQSAFSVTIQPKSRISLESFRVFTDGCGGMKITLKGGDLDEEITRGLNKGRSQIALGNEDYVLEPGITYTLTCTAFVPYGGCSDSKTPHFEDASACGVTPTQHSALTLNQSGKLFLYEFKFLY